MRFKTELTSIHFGDTTIEIKDGFFEDALPAELENFLRLNGLITEFVEDEVKPDSTEKKATSRKKKD